MNKKLVFICLNIITLIFVVLIFLNIIFFGNLATYESKLTIDKENNVLYANTNEDIKVLQLTDIQIDGYHDMPDPFIKVKELIHNTKPDLIVLTGDNLDNIAGLKDVFKLADFMDSFKIPWATIYGNHDYLARVSIEKQNKIYENSKYCLFKTGKIKDSNGNYYYTIKNQDKTLYSLIFIDSKKNGFSKEHTLWYEEVVNKINQENNKNIPSMIFCHIPIPETQDAYSEYILDNSIGDGILGEEISPHKENVGIFDKILELNSTKIIAFGHDHLNTLHVKYKDIMFCYGVKVGLTCYFDENIQGGCLYKINDKSEVFIEKILL